MVATLDSGTALTRNADPRNVGGRSRASTDVEHRKGMGKRHSNSNSLAQTSLVLSASRMAAEGAISSGASHASKLELLPHHVK